MHNISAVRRDRSIEGDQQQSDAEYQGRVAMSFSSRDAINDRRDARLSAINDSGGSAAIASEARNSRVRLPITVLPSPCERRASDRCL